MVNQQVLEGNWSELTGQIKQRWAKLTDNELQEVRGNAEQLVGLIQRKTGEARERIEDELESLVAEGGSMAARATAAVRHATEEATERVQQGYEQVSDKMKVGYGEAERVVKERPIESVAVAFGSGLIAGVIVGLVLRPR